MALPLFIAGAAGLLALLAGCKKNDDRAKNEQKPVKKDTDLDARPLPKPVMVTDMYWSATENYSKIGPDGKHNSFYVDLNLHIVTENEGVLENITIRKENDDELYDGNKDFDPTTKDVPVLVENEKKTVYVFKNVLKELKLKLNQDNSDLKIVAKHKTFGKVAKVTVVKPRPRWVDVFDGYPKVCGALSRWADANVNAVFENVLGENYNHDTFNNACATRVSIGLLHANVIIPKEPTPRMHDIDGKTVGVHGVKNKKSELYGSYFISSAKYLQEWLNNVWGPADIQIDTEEMKKLLGGVGSDMKQKAKKLIGNMNGIYVILFPYDPNNKKTPTGHATLWVGEDGDAIGNQNVLDKDKSKAYLWKLK
jgi:hypothetical protein